MPTTRPKLLVTLTESDVQRLELVASRTGLSKSAVIRKAFREYCGRLAEKAAQSATEKKV